MKSSEAESEHKNEKTDEEASGVREGDNPDGKAVPSAKSRKVLET